MSDLHAMFDALVGYLVGMTLIEVVVKPSLIRFGKKSLSSLDDHVGVVPDWLYQDSSEQEPPFDR
jgi:hypothetical protein